MINGTAAPRVFISAGEISGDIVAARLIDELRAADPSAIIDGVGGARMAEAGANVVASADHIGAVGISEGLAVVPSAVGVYRAAKQHVRTHRPHVAVLVANDVFNVALGRSLRALGIPTIALFPPQSWIWHSLARQIAPSLDLVLASFPDEERCYREAGVATEFVGHYLANVLSPATPQDTASARQALGLTAQDPVVAILPGSRAREVERLLSVLLGAAGLIRARVPTVQLVAALTSPRPASGSEALRTPEGHDVRITRDSHAAMRAADVVVCCSGTVTLEAALIGVPMLVAYSLSRTTYAVVRASIRTGLLADDTIAIPNLILGRRVVPEFIQQRVTAPDIAQGALALLLDPVAQQEMRCALKGIRAHVERPDTLAAVARIVLKRARA
jgi:lipid-A-disaccharide synthase